MDKPRGRICDGSPSVGWDIYSVVVKEKMICVVEKERNKIRGESVRQ